jgi:hypothetical protein
MTTDEIERQPQGGSNDGGQQPQMPSDNGEAAEPSADGADQPQDESNGGEQPQMPSDNGEMTGPSADGTDQHQPGQMGEQPGGMGQESNGTEMGILLGVSLLVLLIGLVIAIKYKK